MVVDTPCRQQQIAVDNKQRPVARRTRRLRETKAAHGGHGAFIRPRLGNVSPRRGEVYDVRDSCESYVEAVPGNSVGSSVDTPCFRDGAALSPGEGLLECMPTRGRNDSQNPSRGEYEVRRISLHAR